LSGRPAPVRRVRGARGGGPNVARLGGGRAASAPDPAGEMEPGPGILIPEIGISDASDVRYLRAARNGVGAYSRQTDSSDAMAHRIHVRIRASDPSQRARADRCGDGVDVRAPGWG